MLTKMFYIVNMRKCMEFALVYSSLKKQCTKHPLNDANMCVVWLAAESSLLLKAPQSFGQL